MRWLVYRTACTWYVRALTSLLFFLRYRCASAIMYMCIILCLLICFSRGIIPFQSCRSLSCDHGPHYILAISYCDNNDNGWVVKSSQKRIQLRVRVLGGGFVVGFPGNTRRQKWNHNALHWMLFLQLWWVLDTSRPLKSNKRTTPPFKNLSEFRWTRFVWSVHTGVRGCFTRSREMIGKWVDSFLLKISTVVCTRETGAPRPLSSAVSYVILWARVEGGVNTTVMRAAQPPPLGGKEIYFTRAIFVGSDNQKLSSCKWLVSSIILSVSSVMEGPLRSNETIVRRYIVFVLLLHTAAILRVFISGIIAASFHGSLSKATFLHFSKRYCSQFTIFLCQPLDCPDVFSSRKAYIYMFMFKATSHATAILGRMWNIAVFTPLPMLFQYIHVSATKLSNKYWYTKLPWPLVGWLLALYPDTVMSR